MASPLKSFRKNKKVWFAFLTVVCMVTFVLWSPGARRTVKHFLKQTEVREMAVYGALKDERPARRADKLSGRAGGRVEWARAPRKEVGLRAPRRAPAEVVALKVAVFARLVPEA